MEDYEIVSSTVVPELGDMLPVCKVKTAGEMIADFAEKKEALQNYMKTRYGELVVNEETISSIKKDLAQLRKVEKEIGTIIKTAKADFNRPIELTLSQAEEFKKVITDTINNLSVKQRAVDEQMQAKNLENAKLLYNLIAEQYDPDIQAFAKDCQDWIVKEQWKNKTYTEAQIKADTKQAMDNIRFALQVFQGKYRAQALDKFKKTGNLAEAQNYITEMEEADVRQARFESERLKSATAERIQTVGEIASIPDAEEIVVIDEGPTRPNIEAHKKEVITISAPESYMLTPDDEVVKTLNLSISAPEGVLKWIKELLIIPEKTTYKVITTEMVLSAAEKIMQKKAEEKA